MADELGSLCIVLHGHLPYVLNHGSYPHGEAWLFEAAAETYLPVLDLIGECALMRVRPALTIGLTPVLLEQLAHDRFKEGFAAYLGDRAERARSDRREFEGRNDGHAAYLAARWEDWYLKKLEHFERINRDIPAEYAARFREGHVQILTSNATHAYMPLLLNDEMIRAQLAAGLATSTRWLGVQPRGVWLPECAYRPSWDHWVPPVLYDNARSRVGLEHFLAEAGLTHFFVDNHLVADSRPLGVREHDGAYREVNDALLHWDQRRGWRSPLEPVGVASHPEPPRAYAFARHPRVSEQVWSGTIGYPGAGQYLEFHRKYGDRGLRYHKVTGTGVPLGDKHPYQPHDVDAVVHSHAQHFCSVIKEVLGGHQHHTGRRGVVVAPFDAELFGHWWFEGPQFLRDVILTLANDPQVKLQTAEEALYHHQPDKVVRMPEGSWGEKGNHSVWINDRTRWIWEMEYRAEGTFLRHLHHLPWRDRADVRVLLEKAARELLLLQASDWPFVIHSYGAVDYGIQRFAGHCTRFDRLTGIAERVAGGAQVTNVEQIEIAEADLHDGVFQHIDLGWWLPR
ncbi:MAG TPA: 1,4-alpha-glucan branching protein domain-containing protein [Humisphaera sp.]